MGRRRPHTLTPPKAPRLQRSLLPGVLGQLYALNTVCFTQDNLWTSNGVQYAIWSDQNKQPWVAKRTLPNGPWTLRNLATVPGNPMGSPVTDDPHNNWAVAVSGDGHVHVAGNHHSNPLHYARTSTPGDLTTFVGQGMTGANESVVTYPMFVRTLDGTLLFFYRQVNIAGNYGQLYVNRYSVATHSWTQVGRLLEQATNGFSPYWNHVAVSPTDGTLHLFYCWRTSSTADSNQNICHIKSTDGGTTWKSMAGTTLTLPVTFAASPVVRATPSTGSGLLNSGGADVDAAGHPHAAFHLYDEDGHTQINHVYHDGSAWQVVVATAFTYRQDLTGAGNLGTGNIVNVELSRPAVVCDAEGRTFVLYRHNIDQPSRLILKDVTPGAVRLPEITLWGTHLRYAELTCDSQALRDRDELHVLVSPAGNPADPTGPRTLNWDALQGWVLSGSMSQVAALAGS